MIMINGNWEQIKDLSDVLRIVSENIGNEFAHKVEVICKEIDDNYYDALESLDYLDEQISNLRQYIYKNANDTDFMRGMEKAYDMIER